MAELRRKGLTLRPYEQRDRAAVADLNTSFTTDRIYRVTRDESSVRLEAVTVSPPMTRIFPLADEIRSGILPWDVGYVAVIANAVVGFAASSYQSWNRRLVLWHLYVSAQSRGQGVARALLVLVEAEGRRRGARHIWLETSNLNHPGIEAYRRLGFSFVGVDVTLYDGTPAEGQTAVFLSRSIAGEKARKTTDDGFGNS
jgi:ribosomal protein S18 acetylase RimI-like enzyme